MIAASVRRLEVFKSVIECDGVNAAAEHLGIAQPSVSAHIKALEEEVRTALFLRQRGRRHVTLSAAGEALYRYACDTVARSKEVSETIRRVGTKHELSISAQRILANEILPGVLAELMTTHPSARVSVHSETQERVWELIRSGETDVALLFARKTPERCVSRLLGSLRLAFIASPLHPLAQRRWVTPAELALHGFVGGLEASEFFRLIADGMSDIGLHQCRFLMHLQDSNAVKHAVVHNVGLACTFQLAVQEEVARGKLVILPVTGEMPVLPIYWVVRSSEDSTPLAHDFMEQVSDHLRRLDEGPPHEALAARSSS